MALQTMYPAINNSPQTRLTSLISATDQTIAIENAGVLPAGPNIATIGVEDNAELVRYASINGNTLTGCIRGFNGTLAQVWFADERVYRAYNTVDHDAFRTNIVNVDGRLTTLEGTAIRADGDGTALTTAFTQAAARENIQTGATLGVLFGRIMRWFADLKEGAFAVFGTGASDIARGNHNHAGVYLTAEVDPTVPAWAKEPNRPTYADIGAAAAVHTHAQGDVTGLTTAMAGKSDIDHRHTDYETRLDALETTLDGVDALLAAI